MERRCAWMLPYSTRNYIQWHLPFLAYGWVKFSSLKSESSRLDITSRRGDLLLSLLHTYFFIRVSILALSSVVVLYFFLVGNAAAGKDIIFNK